MAARLLRVGGDDFALAHQQPAGAPALHTCAANRGACKSGGMPGSARQTAVKQAANRQQSNIEEAAETVAVFEKRTTMWQCSCGRVPAQSLRQCASLLQRTSVTHLSWLQESLQGQCLSQLSKQQKAQQAQQQLLLNQ